MSTSFFLFLPLPLKLVAIIVGGFFYAWMPIGVNQAEIKAEEIKVPAPAQVVQVAKVEKDQLNVVVKADGTISIDNKVIAKDRLANKLVQMAKEKKNQAVHIKSDANVEYKKIVEIIDLCQKAGLSNISFATRVHKNTQPNPTK